MPAQNQLKQHVKVVQTELNAGHRVWLKDPGQQECKAEKAILTRNDMREGSVSGGNSTGTNLMNGAGLLGADVFKQKWEGVHTQTTDLLKKV